MLYKHNKFWLYFLIKFNTKALSPLISNFFSKQSVGNFPNPNTKFRYYYFAYIKLFSWFNKNHCFLSINTLKKTLNFNAVCVKMSFSSPHRVFLWINMVEELPFFFPNASPIHIVVYPLFLFLLKTTAINSQSKLNTCHCFKPI